MTDTAPLKHVQTPGQPVTYCGHPLPDLTLTAQAEDLAHAHPGEVCPACLAQVMEDGRDHLPDVFTAYAWPENHPRTLSETFPTLPGVHAYRLAVAAVLTEQGDALRHFEYTRN